MSDKDSHIVPPAVWDKMTNQEKDDFNKNPISDPERGVHELIPQHKEGKWFSVPKPSMTDRDRLAEKIYLAKMKGMTILWDNGNFRMMSDKSIEAANTFFDTLENNNEDG